MPTKPLIKNIPTDLAERRVAVIAALRLGGSSLRRIAKRIGLSESAVANALMLPSIRAEEAIAEELGVPVHLLFHERYAPDGRRLCQTKRKRSTAAQVRNAEGEEAA